MMYGKKLFRPYCSPAKAMVLNSAFSACRESSRVCWTTTGASLTSTLENGVSVWISMCLDTRLQELYRLAWTAGARHIELLAALFIVGDEKASN